MKRYWFMGLIAALVSLMAISYVFAAVGEDAAVTRGATGQFTQSPATPGSTVSQGGNVSRIDVETNGSTTKWQGFYGNVTGRVALGLGADILYDFGSAPVVAVYAARDQNFDFSSIQVTTAAQIDTAFGFNTAAEVDQAADLYTATIANIDGVNNPISTTLEDTNFDTYAVDDGSNAAVTDFAFGGEVINLGAPGFDGNAWQYELMVPINAGTPTFYFFMSI